MELAVHMRNIRTGERRIKKVFGKNASIENWKCSDFHSKSEWQWTGTEPFQNIADDVVHLRKNYYTKKN